jgi:hypothetical protein
MASELPSRKCLNLRHRPNYLEFKLVGPRMVGVAPKREDARESVLTLRLTDRSRQPVLTLLRQSSQRGGPTLRLIKTRFCCLNRVAVT